MAAVERDQAQYSPQWRYAALAGWGLACVAVDRPSPLATGVTAAAAAYVAVLLLLWAWKRRGAAEPRGRPPIS